MYRGRVGYERDPKPFLKEKAIEKSHQMHLAKIREIKGRLPGTGTTDNSLPSSSKMKHLMLRQKQKAMITQRNNEIATENRILLQKMTKIITSIPPELVDANPDKPNKSLNARGRSTEIERISKENHKILERMMNVSSMHDHKQMQAEFAHHDKLLKRLRMVKYTPSDASLSEVSKRGVREMDKEMTNTLISTTDGGHDLEVGSVLSQSVFSQPTLHSSATKKTKGSKSKGSKIGGGGGNGDRAASSSRKVPMNIETQGSAPMIDPEVTRRRNHTKDELTLLAHAAMLDKDMEDEEEDDFDESKQDMKIDNLMKKHNVTNPKARHLTKRVSALDMTRGEYNLVKQTKGVAIMRNGIPVDRDQALVVVTKKRDGRIRVQVKNDGPSRIGLEINCFADVGVVEARKLLDVENKHFFGEGEEGAKASAAKREELLELSWGLIDFAQVQFEPRGGKDDGERLVVVFVNPLLCAQQSILPGGKIGSERSFDLVQQNLPNASQTRSGSDGRGSISSPNGSRYNRNMGMSEPSAVRPTTAEIIAVVDEEKRTFIEVVDAPETELDKSVELAITLKNKRRPGVVDIVAEVVGGNPNFGAMIDGGVMLTSVGIPTLVSIDPELTTSYVRGLIGSLKIQLKNLEKRDGEIVDVGPRLLVKGGRPQTRA
jgi:hypothetical protein